MGETDEERVLHLLLTAVDAHEWAQALAAVRRWGLDSDGILREYYVRSSQCDGQARGDSHEISLHFPKGPYVYNQPF